MAPVKKPPHKLGRQYLREWRLSKRPELTQAKVADALDIDQSVISRLETGKTPYEQIMLERLAKLYGCEPADLIHGPPGGNQYGAGRANRTAAALALLDALRAALKD
jgi:transcriptional regulator with XRE-family HTH domain